MEGQIESAGMIVVAREEKKRLTIEKQEEIKRSGLSQRLAGIWD